MKEAFECKYVSPKNWRDYGIIDFRELPQPWKGGEKIAKFNDSTGMPWKADNDTSRPTIDSNPKAFKP